MPRAETLTTSTYERLRGEILAGRAAPGERLSIALWAEELGVSPGAVREALSRLTAESLVQAEPQRGFRVAPVSRDDLRELTSARCAIEELVLRRSLVCGDVAWEAGVVAAQHTLAQLHERAPNDEARLGEAWSLAHAALHDAIAAGCDNRYLLQVRRSLYAKSERYRRLSLPLAGGRRDVGKEHRALVRAVLARDADRAAALLTAHLQATTRILLQGLEGD